MAQEEKKLGLFARMFGLGNRNTGGDTFGSGGNRPPEMGGGATSGPSRAPRRRSGPIIIPSRKP
jgi:hypothetical protein